MMKKIISVLLCLCVLFLTLATTSFATSVDADVYGFYGNNMLFKQRETAVISGTCSIGSTISLDILKSDNSLFASDKTTVDESGKFEVSFLAPEGSYEEYTAVLKQNGMTFKTLTGIVFGEMWLASGQSNMEYYMYMDKSWDSFEKNGYGNKWVRGLCIKNEAMNGISDIAVPRDKQENITDAQWVKGSEKGVSNMSSCAYYFANSLQKQIGMPVGVLCSTVGGSRIDTWLSRETVESDKYAMSILERCNSYIAYDEWFEKCSDFPGTFTSNFNARIYPLRNFKISGMIWYQGEADICSKNYGEYTYLLNLLQEQNTKNFKYSGKKLPIIYSTLASYDYGYKGYGYSTRNLQDFNFELANFQEEDPITRACISNFDTPLTFYRGYTTIHPNDKQPVGERMAFTAMGLVYGRKSFYGIATFDSYKIIDNCVYITFNNVGEGLKAKDGELRGFAVCGEDGVYYRADAKIISKDTVMVTCDSIEKPVGATYAFSYLNCRANLYSTCYGEYLMPVSPVITNREYQKYIYCDYAFADCESDEVWKMAYPDNYIPDDLTGYYKAWNTALCRFKTNENSAYKGSAGLNVQSISPVFSLTQNFQTKQPFGETHYFTSYNSDFTVYGAMSFMVRNNGNEPVSVYCKLFGNSKWYSASLNGNGATHYIIPNDREWHEVELNFSSVYENDKGNSINGTSVLNSIEKFELVFEAEGKKSNLDIDEFNFKSKATLDDNLNGKENAFQKIVRFISSIIVFIRNQFISVL